MEIRLQNRQRLGAWGEALAAEYLRRLGYEILATNYRTRFGELDLVCRDGIVWCFVEVKTRRGFHYGLGYQGINLKKQRHLFLAAQVFLSQEVGAEVPVRFDVVSIDYKTTFEYEINLFKNAFIVTEELIHC